MIFEKIKEELQEKIKVTNLEIIVTGTEEKPYFEIKYKEVGKEDYNIGYSSYDLNNVFNWKEECFEIVNQVETEYNQTVTNADRIRRMTDEELAQIIMCPYENMSGECMCEKDTRTNCIQCCLEWLRKEVEEKDE